MKRHILLMVWLLCGLVLSSWGQFKQIEFFIILKSEIEITFENGGTSVSPFLVRDETSGCRHRA